MLRFPLTFSVDCLYFCTPDFGQFLEGKMKPSAIHHLIPVAAWRHKPKTQEPVLERVRTITRDLETLQAEMHTQLTAPAAPGRNRFLEDGMAVQVLSQFKAELDQLRRILWFYIEQAEQKPAADMDHEQARRLDRVTGLLSALSPQPGATSCGEQSGSFFERLNVVIDTYMQEKKPVSGDSNTGLTEQTKASS